MVNDFLIEFLGAIIGLAISFGFGFAYYFFPEKYLNTHFNKWMIFPGNLKSVDAFYHGFEEVYGKKEGTKKIKRLGLFMIILGIAVTIISIFYFSSGAYLK